jgi:hypothetical protein
MNIDPPLLSAVSALIGALMGGGASLTAAIYTQRRQDRLQRVAREITKRETVYADFIMTASKLLLQAYVSEGVRLDADEQHLIGLANRMRLFAPRSVIEQAEAVIRKTVDLSRKPSMDVRKLTVEKWPKGVTPIRFYHSAWPLGPTWITCTRPSSELKILMYLTFAIL